MAKTISGAKTALTGFTQARRVMAVLQHDQTLHVGDIFGSVQKAASTQSSVMSINSLRGNCRTRVRARSIALTPFSFGRSVSMKVRVET